VIANTRKSAAVAGVQLIGISTSVTSALNGNRLVRYPLARLHESGPCLRQIGRSTREACALKSDVLYVIGSAFGRIRLRHNGVIEAGRLPSSTATTT
jgi:hypothetical protein